MTQVHRASLHPSPTSRPASTQSVLPSAKLELTYPYLCGQRVAAEFDARVAVGLEDNVLLIGEIELYGFDANNQGAYEVCADPSLCNLIRRYIEASVTERDRAYEVLGHHKVADKTQPFRLPDIPARSREPQSPARSPKQDFRSFVNAYASSFVVPPNDTP
ncbi:hypothetical protein [Kiloniella litopenaei]|nr:hypothetical protein [Kiloniella litopenaei]